MLTGSQTEKLMMLVKELLENDPQFTAALPTIDVSEVVVRPGIALADLIRTVCEGYADRPALARRATELLFDPTTGEHRLAPLPRFESLTYAEVWERSGAIAAALWQDPVQRGDRIATIGFPSVDYTIFDIAIVRLGATAVPLHAGVPARRLQPMIHETEPTVLAVSADHLPIAVELARVSAALTKIVVFDHHVELDAHRTALEGAVNACDEAGGRVEIVTIDDAVALGRTRPEPPHPSADPDQLATIIYTSGSSGSPKGAMHPQSLVAKGWGAVASTLVTRGFAIPAITLNYLPMSHTGGRAMLYATLGAGGSASFPASSDLSTMLEDLALVRPTQLNLIPRVWELLHDEYLRRMRLLDAVDDFIEEEVLAELRTDVLGGRFISALTGSAPIAPDLAAWVERLLDAHLMDAMGATESGGVIIDGRIQQPPITDFKLVDVPELGYFSTDRPHARGELLIKSATLFRGYYKRDDLTAEAFDQDGFYRTGDIVAQDGDLFRYVDRRNAVLKLSNGEFVTVSTLEALYESCPSIDQIFVHGNSARAFLLAVVVPTHEARIGRDPDDLRRSIIRELQDVARGTDRQPFEIPRDVIIETTPFTIENGLLTGTGKPARPALKQHYGDRLEERYDEIAKEQDDRRQGIASRAGGQPVIVTVCESAAIMLGLATDDPEPGSSFVDLGGDSLAAVGYASLLSDLFGVELPVGVVISPTSDLQSIADRIEELQRDDSSRPTFASVHGAGATEAKADQLTLDAFLTADVLAGASSIAPPSSEVRTVLLTGATGYLGRYLALEWLERMAPVGGTVVCLVRAKDDVSARARLDDAFDSGDDGLLTHYRALADHLEVIAGDKGLALLGLDPATWRRLADEVDLIVDPAALVNHMLPYPQLFGPNVVGTAEVIALALSSRLKPIAYVSSLGVGAAPLTGALTEDADIRTLSPTRPIDDLYASGYGTSKWASEVLLREAHDRFGLPASVFRCDMLMAEPRYRGQLNVPDMVTRLIFSLAVTGLAPASFYLPEPDGARARSHFDGLPVDFVAQAIATLGTDTDRFRTFNVVNPHDDGIGLDEYADWIDAAGYPLERIADHGEWFARFEMALQNLPEAQRKASIHPIIDTQRHQLPAQRGTFAPADRFAAAVAEAEVGGRRAIPGIDEAIIAKYLSDLELLGLLDATERRPEATASDHRA